MYNTLLKNKLFTIMTNKKFFQAVANSELVLCDDLTLQFHDFSNEHIWFHVLCKNNASPILVGNIYMKGRGFDCSLNYCDANDCIISPYELRTWCPRLFFHFCNYLKWIEAYAIDLKHLLSQYMTYYLSK